MRDRLKYLIKDAAYNKGCVSWDELADYLIANGVIVPPCKVGDTVYVIATKHPCHACYYCTDFCHKDCHIKDKAKLVVKKATVRDLYIGENVKEILVEIEQGKDLHSYTSTYYFDNFGKTVFLTREEAEEALAERNKNN